MEDPLTKRRRFLQGAGVSGTALLAGCSGILDSDDTEDQLEDQASSGDELEDAGDDGDVEGEDDSDGTEGEGEADDSIQHGDGDSREIGLVAQPDEEELIELQQEVQSGEIEQGEAIERQQEIIAEGVENLAAVLEDETSLEITDEFDEIGAIKATGEPAELIDTTTSARVSALVSVAALEEQMQGQQVP